MNPLCYYLVFMALLIRVLAFISLSFTLIAAEPVKPSPDPAWSTATFSGLHFRSIGPAMISGRIVDIAVDPANSAHYFIAAASGGVWKTINNGNSLDAGVRQRGLVLHWCAGARSEELSHRCG